MAHQFGTTVRNNMASQLTSALAGGSIKMFSGATPANCAAADPAGLLASGTLPGTAATNTAGVVSKSGTWSFTGSAGGTIASFRLYDSGGACVHQGNVTATGGGGDMTIDNTNIANAQNGTVTGYTVTVGGA